MIMNVITKKLISVNADRLLNKQSQDTVCIVNVGFFFHASFTRQNSDCDVKQNEMLVNFIGKVIL
jgi:hypothetical protein